MVSQVLLAGMWQSQDTFNTFSFMDVIHRVLNTFSIGAAVVAQHTKKSPGTTYDEILIRTPTGWQYDYNPIA